MSVRIESLAIGDELLDGRVLDANTRDLGQALAELGLELAGARTVPDDRAAIIAALTAAAARCDIIVTSGGLGPTTDDITAECIAEAAGQGMRFDDAAWARIEAMFAARGMPLPANNRRQAMLPAASRTLQNDEGTAPGFVTPLGAASVWSFPGVPREYKHLMNKDLLPAVQARMHGAQARVLVRRTFRCLGLAESAIGERLAAFEKAHPEVRVQYRVAFPEIVMRLVWEHAVSTDPQVEVAFHQAADALTEEARAAVGSAAYGVGDASLEERVHALLAARGETLAVAESCTGGLVAKRLTDLPGSSRVMRGGVVAYDNAVKTALLDVQPAVLEAHGAVSEPVAAAMAAGARARLQSTWAVATTGIAGPDGGTAAKPVGTVVFAVAGPHNTVVTKRLPNFGRERVREMAAATALRLLLDTAAPAAR